MQASNDLSLGNKPIFSRGEHLSMWPFKQRRRKLTADAFAAEIWSLLMRRACPDFVKQFTADVLDADIRLESLDEAALEDEILLAQLWTISKTFCGDKPVLDALHGHYFAFQRKFAETPEDKEALVQLAVTELTDRYEAYYKAWEADEEHRRSKGHAGFALTSEMLNHFLPRHRTLNASLSFTIGVRVYSFMKFLGQIRKEIEIIG